MTIAAVAGHVERNHAYASSRMTQFGVGGQIAEQDAVVEIARHIGLDAVRGHIEVAPSRAVVVFVRATLDMACNQNSGALDQQRPQLVGDKAGVDAHRNEVHFLFAAVHSYRKVAHIPALGLLGLKVGGHVTTHCDEIHVCHY